VPYRPPWRSGTAAPCGSRSPATGLDLRERFRRAAGPSEDDALGAADVAEPVAVLVLGHLADEVRNHAPAGGQQRRRVVHREQDATQPQRVRGRVRLGGGRRRDVELRQLERRVRRPRLEEFFGESYGNLLCSPGTGIPHWIRMVCHGKVLIVLHPICGHRRRQSGWPSAWPSVLAWTRSMASRSCWCCWSSVLASITKGDAMPGPHPA
jgi:hypothetical protein